MSKIELLITERLVLLERKEQKIIIVKWTMHYKRAVGEKQLRLCDSWPPQWLSPGLWRKATWDWWPFTSLMGEVVWCQLSKRSSGAINTLYNSPGHTSYIKFISFSKFSLLSLTYLGAIYSLPKFLIKRQQWGQIIRASPWDATRLIHLAASPSCTCGIHGVYPSSIDRNSVL